MNKLFFAAMFSLLFLPSLASAATINAASCSYTDVSAAISAAQNGDTVLVPAGNCTWTSTLTITKGITLQGAGADKTIIRSDGPSGVGVYIIDFNADQATAANNYPFQLSGFTLQQISALYGCLALRNQNVSNELTKVVVHDNKFIGRAGATPSIGMVHELGVFGVVYNNTIQDVSHAWRFLGNSAGRTQIEEWVPGTSNAMYYENNYIYSSVKSGSSLIVSGGDANRYVARYNTINLSVEEPFGGSMQSYDIHGNQDNNPTGGIGLELYGNLRIRTRGRWIDQRGGQVFFFYNQWLTTDNMYTGGIYIWEEYNDDDFCAVPCPEGSRYGRTAEGNCIQRVHDSYYWRNYGGVNGNMLSNTSYVLFDHYHRGNNILNNPLIMFENDGWFKDNTAAFDGTIAPVGSCGYYNGGACIKSGVGCGTLAQMNAITPSAPGLGFWVTDQSCSALTGMAGRNPTIPISGTLYRAEDDGQGGYEWVAYYTPYIYPHPLTVAPFGTAVCGEGQITSSCWCEGMKANGYCCHGYYQTGECSAAETCNQYKRLNSTTLQACSCNQTDVQAAVSAAQSGDTVLVPAGNCAWNSTLTITKGITLQGAGMDNTTLTGQVRFVSFEPDANAKLDHDTLKIKGFTFDGVNSTSEQLQWSGLIVARGTTPDYVNLVVLNNKFKNTLATGIMLRGIYGVAAHNQFDSVAMVIRVMGNDYNSWNTQTQDYGTANNFYFEDNSIFFSLGWCGYAAGWPGWIETGQGGRIAVRYNTWDEANNQPGEYWDVHGLQNVGASGKCEGYSTMVAEYYGNSILHATTGYRWMYHRGGWLMMYNNALDNPNSYGGGSGVAQYYCDTCQQTGSFKQKATNTYFWNNRQNGVVQDAYVSDPGSGFGCPSDPIIENADFFNHNASCTKDSCSTGVGCGSDTPTGTCTLGAGYWKTSQSCSDISNMVGANPATPISGTFYKCTAPNTWTAYYTPYTYPHPLAGGLPPQQVAGVINGDGDVDVNDLVLIGTHFGQRNTHPQWNAAADAVASGEIDIYDVVFVASRFS